MDEEYGGRSWTEHPAVLGLLLAAICGLLVLAYWTAQGRDDSGLASEATGAEALSSEPSTASTAAEDPAAASAVDDTSDPTTTDEAGEADSAVSTGPPAAPPAPDGPFVMATLNLDALPNNGFFVLKGRVHDQDSADRLIATANEIYPFAETDVEVDETMDPAPWLAAGPKVIGLLPAVTDGTVLVSDGKVDVSVRAPSEDKLIAFKGAVGVLSGLPVEEYDAVITNQRAPELTVDRKDDTITLVGTLPSEDVAQYLTGAAIAAYGEESVKTDITIDPGTYRALWMQAMTGLFQLFRVFPDYEVRVQNDQFVGTIRGGLNFESGSTELIGPGIDSLNFGITGLKNDVRLAMRITGHTDNVGDPGTNQALSLARAQAVVDYFEAAGIDPSRMVAVGKGETEPIASNDTEEGRAANRRVEFEFGPSNNLLDG